MEDKYYKKNMSLKSLFQILKLKEKYMKDEITERERKRDKEKEKDRERERERERVSLQRVMKRKRGVCRGYQTHKTLLIRAIA